MNELLASIDWAELLQTIWTVVLIPLFTWIGKEIHDWAKTKKLEKYTDMLYQAVINVVKELYQTTVDSIKDTDEWTPEKQAEVKEIAKTKVIQSLTTDAYNFLKTVNADFDQWIDSLIEAVVYDYKPMTVN